MKAEKESLLWLTDPRVFAVNRIDAHSDHIVYPNVEEALLGADTSMRQSLNGSWKFHYSRNPGQRPLAFYEDKFCCKDWDSIEVPGHIQLQGWDKCQYINTMYPWDGHSELRPPEISEEYNPVGSYVKEFTLQECMKNKRTYLSFQGVETAFYVWLNGNFVGYSEDSFTPAEFEITEFLREGVNKLALEVYKYSSASWIQDQDFWRFSGIFREVYLYTVPAAHLKDLFVITNLTEDYSAASLNLKMKLQLEDASDNVFADLILTDVKGKEIYKCEKLACKEEMKLLIPVSHPQLWSAEIPSLYRLLIHLYDKKGRTWEAVSQKVGIRKFEIKNNMMCLNGKRIIFHGINRHEFNCRHGRAITKEDMLWDIKFLKQNNINAVRTSHYPNQSEWYRLCDEYGIYLIDEANLESHGSWQKMGQIKPEFVVPGDQEDWLEAVLDRAKSMLERDKNHPSVLIWSCGNESYGGIDIFKMSEYFRREDPTRPVHYEGIFHDRRYNATSDIESRMYAKPEEIESYLQNNPQKPYISCEYMHAMGNSCGGLQLYTDLEQKYPLYQGGFIWDFIDQALLVKDCCGRDQFAYGGDFDDRATDYHFCTDGIVYAQREPSPKVQEVKFLYQSISIVPDANGVSIANHHLFISTEIYDLEYCLLHDGKQIFNATINCKVAPGDQKYFPLKLPKTEAGGEYALNCSLRLKESTVWAEQGHEQAFGQFVWKIAKEIPASSNRIPLTVVHGDVNIGVQGGGFSVLFSLQEGGMVSLCKNGQEYITRPPMPFYWRASTDNDKGNGYPFRCAPWYAASAFQKYFDAKVEEKNGLVCVTYFYKLPLPVPVVVTVAYTVQENGTIRVQANYPGAQALPELPVFGLSFRLKKKYHQFQWYGMGPDENYIDRACGARLGIFQSTAEKNLSQYIVPQECGNRTGVRWAKITNEQGGGLLFSSRVPFELGVLPYTAFELENALHAHELPQVNYTVVNIMAKQMGVGGDDSWGAPVHEQYLIPSAQPLELEFTIDFSE